MGKEALVAAFALSHLKSQEGRRGLIMSHRTSCAPEPTCRQWGAASTVPLSFLDLEGRRRLSTATDLPHLIISSACPSSTLYVRSLFLWCQSGILGEGVQMFRGSSAPTPNRYFPVEFWRDVAVLAWGVPLTVHHWIQFDRANANKDRFYSTRATEN